MEEKRYKISKTRIILTFTILGVVLELLVLGGMLATFIIGEKDIDYLTMSLVGIAIIVMMVVFSFMTLKNSYYLIDKKGIRYVRPGKDLYYPFDTFLYVDEQYSEKHKVMLVYNDQGKDVYIPFDEKGEIYKATLKYASKLVTKEEYRLMFPNAKL